METINVEETVDTSERDVSGNKLNAKLSAISQSTTTSQLDMTSGGNSKIHNQFLGVANSMDSISDYVTKFNVTNSSRFMANNLKRDRWPSKRMRRRLIFKNGECNVAHANIKKRRQRFLADIFTTLVDIKWRWNLLIFVLAFTLSWLLFALIWWLICFSHGDFQHFGQDGWKPCVDEVYDFTTALLFSIETQHTIGYGSRQTTSNCPEAVLMMMTQSCFGVIIQALMTGLVFAKLSRPKKRAETLMFSKNACICKRDGVFCLLFRVGDMRKSHIVEAHVRALLIKKRVTMEGEEMPLYQHEVDIGDEEGESRLFLVWPVILEHKITESSPFWEMSAEGLLKEQFELIVIMEGIVESTGMTAQARTSYLPGEILWGHRFERLVTFQRETAQYQVNYAKFHSTVPVDIPACSARELAARTRVFSVDTSDEDDSQYVDVEEAKPGTQFSHRQTPTSPTHRQTQASPAHRPQSSPAMPVKHNGLASALAFGLPGPTERSLWSSDQPQISGSGDQAEATASAHSNIPINDEQ